MLAGEAAIERLACEMMARHGSQAALRAVDRLNERIDAEDWSGRDLWAAVVHAIHELRQAGSPPLHSPARPPAHQ